MNLEPPNLNVPLYRRNYAKVWLPILAGVAAWLAHRPTALPQAAISFFVGGAFIWFVWGSSFSYSLLNHHIPVVRGLWWLATIVGVVLFMRHVLPYLHALV